MLNRRKLLAGISATALAPALPKPAIGSLTGFEGAAAAFDASLYGTSPAAEPIAYQVGDIVLGLDGRYWRCISTFPETRSAAFGATAWLGFEHLA